jgi:hypothetical protein
MSRSKPYGPTAKRTGSMCDAEIEENDKKHPFNLKNHPNGYVDPDPFPL